jgi:hypothetical protein
MSLAKLLGSAALQMAIFGALLLLPAGTIRWWPTRLIPGVW